jgi:hypothetical protein
MIITSTRPEVGRGRPRVSSPGFNTSVLAESQAPQARSGLEGASISTNLQAMSTNVSINRVLSDVMGPKEGSGNSSADALTAAFSSSPEQAVTSLNGSSTSENPPSLPPNVQNLIKFGGDRKQAVETLVASGAKAENPEVGFVKDVFRKLGLGGDKTVSKDISADQTVSTKVKTRNYNLLDLRLTTRGTSAEGHETRRHTDLETDGMGDGGWTAQVKDAGKVIGKGTPTRMFEQNIKHGAPGEQSEITNNYIDPKTGVPFLRTSEQANWIEADKMGTVKSHKNSQTYRQIEMLGANGKTDQRYVFDYANKSIRLEFLDGNGQLTGRRPMSKDTDYWGLVDRLSLTPPSSIPARPPSVAFGEGGAESPADDKVLAMAE